MRRRRPGFLAPAVALLLAGCPQVAPDLPTAVPSALEAEPAYRIQAGDVLSVRLYLEPELNEDVTVRPDGRISTTLAQSVPAANRTPDQVAASLRQAYAGELRHADLTVEVKSFGNNVVDSSERGMP